MNELTCSSSGELPVLIEDLAKFVLVGREKLTSVRAEIRAINKLHLAEEVRTQKCGEARMLSEALLDAEVRIGELLKQLPKAGGGDRRSADFKSDSAVDFEKSKKKAVEDLGFSQKQAERFETLANHPDLVEQVKAEARENDDLPTRTAVLNLAKYKEDKRKAEYQQIDEDARLAGTLNTAIAAIQQVPVDRDSIEAMRRAMAFMTTELVMELQGAIHNLMLIKGVFEGR